MNAPVTAEQIQQQARREKLSQATSVEQSRAVAEVQAAVVVAQQRPRHEAEAMAKAIESCRQFAVAEGAFYKFPRGGQTVSGESISLAVELARCWGNINYGIMELARNDDAHESEMLAFGWDLETNVQSRQTFIVPHKRDTKGGPKVLTDMRDIYENNANSGARRLRECIFRVLPPYLKEAAKRTCYETLEKGPGDKPLTERIAGALDAFQKIGISQARLEAKSGSPRNWTAVDVAQLEVSYRSIKRQEVSADEEFPRLGSEEATEDARRITGKAKGAPDRKTKPADTVTQDTPNAEEGPSDEDRGEAHVETEGADADQAETTDQLVERLKAKARSVDNLMDLDAIDKELRAAEGLTDEQFDAVTASINARATALRKPKTEETD